MVGYAVAIRRSLSDFWWYRPCVVFIMGVVFSLCVLRFPELITMMLFNPVDALKIAVVMLTLILLLVLPPQSLGIFARRIGLIVVIILTLKSDIDTKLSLPSTNEIDSVGEVSNYVAIVTGASSGIGLSTVEELFQRNITVVMACRSLSKCSDAKHMISKESSEGKLFIMELDLADLLSVRRFVNEFSASFHRLDIIVNNAGSLPPTGSKTAQGFEMALGSMHIGKLLTTFM